MYAVALYYLLAMRFFFVFLCLVGVIACNNQRVATAPQQPLKRSPDSQQMAEVIPPEPDPYAHRRNLFGYLSRHKRDTVFDTVDDAFSKYWGPDTYPPYEVMAGHLFSPTQFHCILFYDDENAGMYVYVRKHGNWQKIFQDTGFHCTNGRSGLQLKDWNGDHVPDIFSESTGATSNAQTFALWLMKSDGLKVYPIQDFEDVPNPEIDSATGNINFNTVASNSYLVQGTYSLRNYKLQLLNSVSVSETTLQHIDSSGEIMFTGGKDDKKIIYCRIGQAHLFVPGPMKDNVAAYFNTGYEVKFGKYRYWFASLI